MRASPTRHALAPSDSFFRLTCLHAFGHDRYPLAPYPPQPYPQQPFGGAAPAYAPPPGPPPPTYDHFGEMPNSAYSDQKTGDLKGGSPFGDEWSAREDWDRPTGGNVTATGERRRSDEREASTETVTLEPRRENEGRI